MLLRTVIFTCGLWTGAQVVSGQFDGSFWWNNKQLLEKASESRNNKKVDFKGESTAVEEHSNHSERFVMEEHAAIDCTCMNKCKCKVAFDANNSDPMVQQMLSNTNSGGRMCRNEEDVCCHIIKLPIPRECFDDNFIGIASSTNKTPQRATSTTPRSPKLIPFPPLEINLPAVVTTTHSPKDLIVYPDDARVVEYPFLLKLFRRDGRHGLERVCGATLISNDSAITAQHCIRGSSQTTDFAIETMDKQKRIIQEIVRHPQYYSGGLYNDVAIIKWRDPLRLNDNTETVDLPVDKLAQSQYYRNCSLVAFEDSDNQFEIHQINENATLMDRSTCEDRVKRSKWGNRFRLHTNFSCIETDRLATSCPEGNSRDGHPLVCYSNYRNHPVLMGIISWYSCQKTHPDILVDIRRMVDWIQSVRISFTY